MSLITNVRQAIAASITQKGVTLANTATLWDCKRAIDQITVTSGIDTSDATASASAIAYGFTAYVNGVKVTGTHTCPTTNFAVVTATADKVLSGYNFFNASGELTAGTYTPLDVSDTTATVHDVVSGKDFYDSTGTKKTGMITVVSSQPSPTVSVNASTGVITAAYTPEAGFSSDNEQKSATLQLDSSNVPTLLASNIKKDVDILGVTGTFEGGTSYYKCASVDSSAKTWTGYLYDSSTQSLADTATSLTYSSSVAPTVGHYYTQDGGVDCSNMFERMGLIFFAPLTNSQTTDEAVATALTESNVTFTTVNGVPCCYFNGNSYISTSYYPTVGGNPWSFSLFVKNAGSEEAKAFMLGRYYEYGALSIGFSDAGKYIFFESGLTLDSPSDSTVWHAVACTFDGTTVKCYSDGVLLGQNTINYDVTYDSGGMQIGRTSNASVPQSFTGYISSLKIFNRAITQAEITAEYNRLQAMVTA